jgi:hypothetical protein
LDDPFAFLAGNPQDDRREDEDDADEPDRVEGILGVLKALDPGRGEGAKKQQGQHLGGDEHEQHRCDRSDFTHPDRVRVRRGFRCLR